jgi:enolase
MQKAIKIEKCIAREVLDSRGFPTVEVELYSGGHMASAIVPSGASTGEGEALELRDSDPKRFLGKGVTKAVQHVMQEIAPAIQNKEFVLQSIFDDLLKSLDGTANKSKLGANSILPVSMAFAKLQSLQMGSGLSTALATQFGTSGVTLPVPLMNIFNGGKHADNGIAIQEFMIVPTGFDRFSESLRAGVEVFHHLKKILHKKGLTTAVGDEGGFAPRLEAGEGAAGPGSHERVILMILDAITAAGYKPGSQIYLALDCAASEYSAKKSDVYEYHFEGSALTSSAMVDVYAKWLGNYPILSIEDGLAEADWDGWKSMTDRLGKQVQLVGDDLFVTNPDYLKKGIDRKIANSILIKLNQIGTVTETLEAMKMAHQANYTTIISHRSGESEDTFIADLAVGTDAGQIKTGSASRTDRLAKYNQLLRIESRLGNRAQFRGRSAFQK